MRKSGLFFITCVCMMHLVTYTNGEVTPPWITLLGCFDAEIGSQIIPLQNNTPTNCFKKCTTVTFVGVQKNTCICSKTFQAIADVQYAARSSYTKCSGQDNRFMFLYTKVSSMPNTINKDADYGHVYVNISSSSSYEFHASKDSHERHNFICYDDAKQCKYRSYPIDRMNSEFAWSECNLVSYFDFVSCLNSTEFANGVFWIGMYRDSPDFSSTLSTLSTKASTFTSTSTSTTTPQLTTETPTPLPIATTDTPSTTSLNVETVTRTASPLRTENINSTENPNRTLTIGAAENPDRTWTIIGAAFIAISVALVIAIIAVLVAFLRKKKDNQISHTDQENIIRRDIASTPKTDQESIKRPESASTNKTDQESIKRPESASTNDTDQKSILRPDSASTLDTDQKSILRPDSASTSHTAQKNIIKPDSASMPSNRRGDHSPGDGKIEQFETDERSAIGSPIRNGLHSEIDGNHMQKAEHTTPFQVEQPHQPLKNQNIAEEPEKIRRHRSHHRRNKDATDLPNTDEENISSKHKKKRKRRKSHSREQTDANILSDTAMEKEEKRRKKRKHRKSYLHAETEDNDVSQMALEHSLLGNGDNDNIKRKERRKSKKRKQKHANTTEESDGINVS